VPAFEAETGDITRIFQLGQNMAGVENVWTGDAFDLREGRPRADKPGFGLYATEEGIQRIVQAKHDFWRSAEDD
jgi:hypothetical protein